MDPSAGTGNWETFAIPLEDMFAIAAEWKQKLGAIEKPWLCWNVSPRWCQLQQKLIRHVGWTPVVGFDPRAATPKLVEGAVLVDFNEKLQLPVLWPHVPLEFAFLFIADRIAYWHADLLVRLPVMEQLAALFASLKDGQMAAVLDRGGLRRRFRYKLHRYWELCGCSTRAASENQFYNGTGWWRHFELHPKCTLEQERTYRRKYHWDSGVGILYWKNKYRGSVINVDRRLVDEGHCSEIGHKNYRKAPRHFDSLRDLTAEIDMNYSIEEVAARLGIAHLLEE